MGKESVALKIKASIKRNISYLLRPSPSRTRRRREKKTNNFVVARTANYTNPLLKYFFSKTSYSMRMTCIIPKNAHLCCLSVCKSDRGKGGNGNERAKMERNDERYMLRIDHIFETRERALTMWYAYQWTNVIYRRANIERKDSRAIHYTRSRRSYMALASLLFSFVRFCYATGEKKKTHKHMGK